MKKIKVLLAEDDPDDAIIVLHKLEAVATVDVAVNKDALRQMLDEPWDIVLIDAALGDYDGKQALKLVKQFQPETPCILVTGSMEYANAVEMMKLGFVDIHEKNRLDRLASSVVSAYNTRMAANELRQHKEREVMDNRSQLIGEMSTSYSHDFRNLLQVFMAGTEMLPKFIGKYLNPVPDEITHVIGAMTAATRRGSDMSDQMMKFVRGSNGKTLKPVAPEYLLTELRQMLVDTFPSNIELSFRTLPGTAHVSCDATQILQVLLNLCVNARYVMPRGGKLSLSAQNISMHQGPIIGDFVMLSVRDTGPGIAPEHLPHIWEHLFTTKPAGQGMGLGLSLAQRIVLDHGGDMDVQTSAEGSTFFIYLPVIKSEPKKETATAKEQFDGQNKLVLIVDDQASMRLLMELSLRDVGYRTLCASSGLEALSYFRHGAPIDVVLTDCVMPLMGGLELAAALRAQSFSIPIIFVTGRTDASNFDPEPDAVIRKPFTEQVLLATLRDILG